MNTGELMIYKYTWQQATNRHNYDVTFCDLWFSNELSILIRRSWFNGVGRRSSSLAKRQFLLNNVYECS